MDTLPKEPTTIRGWESYAIAVIATLIVTGIRFALGGLLGPVAPLMPFVGAVVVSAWFGGLWPGLLAMLLSTMISLLFFIPPFFSLAPPTTASLVAIMTFLVTSVLVSGLCEALHVSRRRILHQRKQRDKVEEQLQFALAAGGMIAWDWNLNTGQVIRSTTAMSLLGLKNGPTEEFSALIHPEDRQRWETALAQAIRGEADFDLEFRVTSPEGRILWMADKGRIRVDKSTGHRHLAGVLTDITARRRAEEVSRASEARFRQVFDAQTVGVIEWNLETNLITAANDHFLKMVGYTREDLAAGKLNFREMTPSNWTRRNEQGIAELRSDGCAPAYEKEYFRSDGSRVPILIAGVRFKDSTCEGMSFIIDLTTRYAADAALRQSEERFRLAADAVNGIIYDTDLQTGQVIRSRGLLEVAGYHPDEVPANSAWWCAQIHPDDLPGMLEQYNSVVACGGTHMVGQYRVKHRAGQWLHVDDRCVLVRDCSNAVIRLVGCTIDITERVEAEEALREADRKKDEFLATLAHELRDPLAPIRNGLYVLKLAGINGKIEQARAMMERQLTHLVRLVDDLLDLSRISRGKMELRRERVELRTILDSAVETARPLIEQFGHQFDVVHSNEPVFVNGDATRLAQVVSNLLNNAARYTHRGGQIRLLAKRCDDVVAITVRDTGIGIPTAMLHRVFEMFTQVDRSLEKTAGGLGIGLSLVRGLVEMHGGTVEVHSEGEARGSEFTVRLPVCNSHAIGVEPASGQTSEDVPAKRCRILIVDDNEDSADSMGQLLELLGYEVRIAHDGEEGVETAGAFRPEVILMDIGMPKLNGYDAARRIRESAWGQTILLVALTGWGQDNDRLRSQDAGFSHHLVKPVAPAELMELLAGLNRIPI